MAGLALKDSSVVSLHSSSLLYYSDLQIKFTLSRLGEREMKQQQDQSNLIPRRLRQHFSVCMRMTI